MARDTGPEGICAGIPRVEARAGIIFTRIDHVEVIVPDLEKEIGFYTGILGFTVFQRQAVSLGPLQEIAYLKLGDTMLELMQVKDPAPQPAVPWQTGCRMIALAVSDMDQALAYLKEKGVGITWGPVAMGRGARAEIKDPLGISIELRQW